MERQGWWRWGAEWGRRDVVGDGGVGQRASFFAAADTVASAASLIGHKAALVIVEAHLSQGEQGEREVRLEPCRLAQFAVKRQASREQEKLGTRIGSLLP